MKTHNHHQPIERAVRVAVLCFCLGASGICFAADFRIVREGNQVKLSWTGVDWWLQGSDYAVSNANWMNITNPPVVIGSVSTVTRPTAGAHRFYRLVESHLLPPPGGFGLVHFVPDISAYWAPVNNATAYNLYFATESGVNPTNYATLSDGGTIAGVTNTGTIASNLIAGRQYYFVVTATNSSTESAPSVERSLVGGYGGAVQGSIFTTVITSNTTNEFFLPGVSVRLQNTNDGTYTAPEATDPDGSFVFPWQPAGGYVLCWQMPGFFTNCSVPFVISNQAVYLDEQEIFPVSGPSVRSVFGTVRFADGGLPSISNPFLDISLKASLSLSDATGQFVRPILLNGNGEYFIGGLPLQTFTLTARAEGAVAQASLPPAVIPPVDLTLPNQAPVIRDVAATTLDGRSLAYWPPGTVVRLSVTADDANNDPLHVLWRPASGSANGFVSSDSSNVLWTVPAFGGIHYIYVRVSDGRGGYASSRVSISNVPLLFSGLVTGDDLRAQTNMVDGMPVVEMVAPVLSNAWVRLNEDEVLTDADGEFTFVTTNDTGPYYLNITAPDYEPLNLVLGNEEPGREYRLRRLWKTPTFFPSAGIDYNNGSSSNYFRIQVSAGGLEREDGGMPGSVAAICYRLSNPCDDESYVGEPNASAALPGTNAPLEIYARLELQIIDNTGSQLQPVSNVWITISAPPDCIADLTNGVPVPISWWLFNTNSQDWEEIGPVDLAELSPGQFFFVGEVPRAGTLAVGRLAPPPAPQDIFLKGSILTFDRTINLPVIMRLDKGFSLTGFSEFLVDSNRFFIKGDTKSNATVTVQLLWPREAPENFHNPDTGNSVAAPIKMLNFTTKFTSNDQSVTVSLQRQLPGLDPAAIDKESAFLAFKVGPGSPTAASNYYAIVDPKGFRTTLAAWKTVNGFDDATNAKAFFYNASDLGFGRGMYMRTNRNGDIAYLVTNFKTVDNAAKGLGPIATVVMEYSPIEDKGPDRVMKFFAYNGAGNRLLSADLDGASTTSDGRTGLKGEKYLPHLCIVCHSASKEGLKGLAAMEKNPQAFNGRLDSQFIPFDLDSYTYGPGGLSKTSGTQLSNFLALNKAILGSVPVPPDKTNAAQNPNGGAVIELVNGWYNDFKGATPRFNGTFIPQGWRSNTDENKPLLYQHVFAVSCRSCHVTREAGLAFREHREFAAKSKAIKRTVESMEMPNAQRTFTIFWGSATANSNSVLNLASPVRRLVTNQPAFLGTALNIAIEP